ncbi:MAG: hypothetical protein ACTHMG_14150 [Sphingomonas sp.]
MGRYRKRVVHLSVAIGRFFEALLYAMFTVAAWAAVELIAGLAALVALVVLARRLLRGRSR